MFQLIHKELHNNRDETLVRVFAGIAVLLAALLPSFVYVMVNVNTLGSELQQDAKIQARALSKAVARNPDIWMYSIERLADSIADIRAPDTHTLVLDRTGKSLYSVGESGDFLHMYRQAAFYDFETEVGTVVVSTSILSLMGKGMLLLLVGMLIGFLVWHQMVRAAFRKLDETKEQLNRSLAALTESESLFRTLAENTSAMVWISGLDKLCFYFNKLYLDFTGRTLEQERGNGWAELVHPEDIEHCTGTFLSSFDRRQEFKMEYRMRRHDGEYRWLLDHGAPRYNEQGIFVGFIGTCMDITERKQAELELQLTQFAMDNASVEIFWLDPQGRICYANQQACETLGYAEIELCQLSIPDIDPLFSVEQWAAHWQNLKLNSIQFFETQHRRRNGEVFPVEVSANYVRFGEHEFNVAFLRDITGRKKNEELIRNLAFYDSLTKLPNRRLLEDRLQQAIAASKRSSRYGALMFLDMDNFKPLNDKYGHAVGDLLLVEVARRLSSCVRETDTVARFGGDEFVVSLANCSKTRASPYVRRRAWPRRYLPPWLCPIF